jgi:hypothetical protein
MTGSPNSPRPPRGSDHAIQIDYRSPVGRWQLLFCWVEENAPVLYWGVLRRDMKWTRVSPASARVEPLQGEQGQASIEYASRAAVLHVPAFCVIISVSCRSVRIDNGETAKSVAADAVFVEALAGAGERAEDHQITIYGGCLRDLHQSEARANRALRDFHKLLAERSRPRRFKPPDS